MTAKTEQGLRRLLQLRAHSRVPPVCHVIVGFHVLRVDVSLVIGVGRLTFQCSSTSFHHAYAIPSVNCLFFWML